MRTISIYISFFIALAGIGWADDSIPTFHYNPQRTGQTEAVGPEEPTLLWNFRSHGSLTASPVVGLDGTLYLASNDGHLYALTQDGQVQWTYAAEESIYGTPALAPDGSILFGDLAGKYYSINADGTEKWIYRITQGKERRIVTAPVVAADGQSYFGSWNEQFYAIRPDGVSRWKTDLSGYLSSAPVLDAEGNVYASVNDSGRLRVYKFEPGSSEKVWTYEENIQVDENRIISSPCIDSTRKRLYIGACSLSGTLYSVSTSNGRRAWSRRLDKGVISSPAIGQDGTIYIGCLNGVLYALDAESGTDRWTFKTDGYFVIGSPSVDGNGVIYVGDSDGVLYAISPDGKELWRWASNNSIESAPVVAPDGTLYFTSTDSTLYALKNPTAVRNWREQ